MTSPRTSQRNRHAYARNIVTLQQQDGGYALLWKRYDNNNMAATLYCCCFIFVKLNSVQLQRENLVYFNDTVQTLIKKYPSPVKCVEKLFYVVRNTSISVTFGSVYQSQAVC